MAEPLEELSRRLDRIEQLLRSQPGAGGPEARPARSIVTRLDDVWVAVTEGNERVAAAVERLTPPGPAGVAVPAGAATGEAVHLRLNRIEEALAGIAGRLDTAAPPPPAGLEAAVADLAARVEAELAELRDRVDRLAAAAAAAAPSAEGSPADRLGRRRGPLRR